MWIGVVWYDGCIVLCECILLEQYLNIRYIIGLFRVFIGIFIDIYRELYILFIYKCLL